MHQSFQQTRLKGVNKMNKLLPVALGREKRRQPGREGSFRAAAPDASRRRAADLRPKTIFSPIFSCAGVKISAVCMHSFLDTRIKKRKAVTL